MSDDTIYTFDAFGLSDIGLVRENNEDVWQGLKNFPFFALADGMGGHRAGEVAAKEAVEFICSSVQELLVNPTTPFKKSELLQMMQLFLESTNSWVHHLSLKHLAYKGMGTTLSTLLFHKNFLIIGNIGDSRIYRYRGNKISQLSEDHSMRNKMIAKGIAPNSIELLNCRNVLTQAVGPCPEIKPQIEVVSVEPGDVYLMCTDGLTDCVSDEEIASEIRKAPTAQSMTKKLIKKAKNLGGHDNVTIVAVSVSTKKGLPGQ